jgi:hypothetical protein
MVRIIVIVFRLYPYCVTVTYGERGVIDMQMRQLNCWNNCRDNQPINRRHVYAIKLSTALKIFDTNNLI